MPQHTQHVVELDIREVLRHLVHDLVPEHHAAALSVRLGDKSEHLAWARLGELECEASNATNAGASKDSDLCEAVCGKLAYYCKDRKKEESGTSCNLVVVSRVRATTLAGVLALTILTDDDPVELAGLAVGERRGRAGQDARPAHVCVLLQRLADGKAEAPERDVIGHIGRTDSAEPGQGREGQVGRFGSSEEDSEYAQDGVVGAEDVKVILGEVPAC